VLAKAPLEAGIVLQGRYLYATFTISQEQAISGWRPSGWGGLADK